MASDFDKRFQDMSAIEPVAEHMCFPFNKDADIEAIASTIASQCYMDTSGVENELLKLQSDIQIKLIASEGSFWKYMTEEKYPNIRKCAMCLLDFFGSTYLCESTISHMKHIKSKNRSTLTDDHLDACLRLAVSAYTPNYMKLVDNMQCQQSH